MIRRIYGLIGLLPDRSTAWVFVSYKLQIIGYWYIKILNITLVTITYNLILTAIK